MEQAVGSMRDTLRWTVVLLHAATFPSRGIMHQLRRFNLLSRDSSHSPPQLIENRARA